ncbi:MAG: CARDB domain-containing protein, partial [Methanomicrobiales archaeon]|nr:CARDB domain-containing protein [Methanomicrobiales archaeon]
DPVRIRELNLQLKVYTAVEGAVIGLERIAIALLLFCFIILGTASAQVTCPSNCICLGAEEAKQMGAATFCGGKQILCGYDAKQNPKYCYEKPVTTKAPPACPEGCICTSPDAALKLGYKLCGKDQILCGYDAKQNPLYCYQLPPPTTTPVPTTIPTGKPDLRIVDVYTDDWPAFHEFRYIIQNAGDAASGPSTTALYIDGVKIGEHLVAGLNPGQNTVGQFPYRGECTGGSDLLAAIADYPNAISESNEDNNYKERSYTCPAVVEKPDLAVSSIRHVGEENLTYTTRAYNSDTPIEFTILNKGDTESPSTEARLYLDGTWVGTRTVPRIPSSGTFTDTFSYIGSCTGTTDTVRVVVDPPDTLIEENEGNNEMTATWNCTVGPLPGRIPDLVIRRAWLTPLPGMVYRVGYEVKNEGTGYTPFTETGLFIDGVYTGQDGTERLGPGESREEEFWFNYTMRTCTGTSDTLLIMADHSNRTAEISEANNNYTLNITCEEVPTTVIPKPDLVITSVFFECTPPCTEYVIRYTVANQGRASAPASDTILYLNYHEFGRSRAPSLSAGAATTVSFSSTWRPDTSRVHVQICADRSNEVDEITPAPSGELNNCMETDWTFEITCDNRVQDRDEEGVDCGGRYCPPCARCSTGAKYAPADTPCTEHWSTDQGPAIGMNTEDDSCAIVEVCHPDLDFIVRDAITCVEHPDYATRFTGTREAEKECACGLARAGSGIDTSYNPSSYKRALALYTIYAFGSCHAYMQGYFYGEICCYGDDLCPDTCSYWRVNPAAWEMGTSRACGGEPQNYPDFMMSGHRCEYYDAWIFGKYGKSGYWKSDTDFRRNSDSWADVPAHASINRLSTGTCVDYSFALTTILRKLGYSHDDVFSVNGDGHGYNLVRFPGESKFHYVDTVGNRGGEIFGGSGYPPVYSGGRMVAWYDYCRNMDEGCSNDYYAESTSHCPLNDQIYSCEGIRR